MPRVAIPPIAPAAFYRRDPAVPLVTLAGEAMGTTWRVLAATRRPAADLRAAIEAALAGVTAEMSHWAPGSVLSRFNAAPVGTPFLLPPDFAAVMACALAVAEASEGAFDPAMGALVDLWGFGPPGPVSTPPTDGAIAPLLRRAGRDPEPRCSPSLGSDPPDPSHPRRPEPGRSQARARPGSNLRRSTAAASTRMDLTLEGSATPHPVVGDGALKLDGASLTRTLPVRLNLSGIAKGFAVDAVRRALGVEDALVEVGGELRGEGIRPDAQPWWVELETPPGCPAPPLRVALHGLSVATSGDYVRHWHHQGRRYAHTLDPRTGRPVENDVVAVSVLAPDAITADAWATALHVLGPAGMPIAEQRGLAVRMLAGNAELLSPALAAMID